MKTAAFNNTFLKHKNQLFAYINGKVANDDAAKDLLQELYLKLYHNHSSIKVESARFFFFRSAKNHCIDWFRKNAHFRHVEFTFEMEAKHEDSTERNELTRHFNTLMEELPALQREVIYLKDVCGMSTLEAIEITGLTENSLRVNLSRARTKLKEGLAKIYLYEAEKKS